MSIQIKDANSNEHNASTLRPSLSAQDSDRDTLANIDGSDGNSLADLFSSKWIEVKKLREIERESGKCYKRGKFSALEEAKVRHQVAEYLRENHISEEEFQDGFFNGKGRDHSKRFFVQVAMSLSGRPVITVYHYLRRLYHPGNRQGAWLPEEDMHLRRLFAVHGPQWELISKALGRYNNSCRDRYRYIRERFIKGPWQQDEIERLSAAVKERQRASVDKRIGAWAWIAEQVGTRSWHQCIAKWTSSLSFRERHPGIRRVYWNDDQDLILLHRIYDQVVRHETELIWSRLIDDSWSEWTPSHLRNRWHRLRKRVRNERNLEMDTIVETLMNSISTHLPM
jgi:hypothetical protein